MAGNVSSNWSPAGVLPNGVRTGLFEYIFLSLKSIRVITDLDVPPLPTGMAIQFLAVTTKRWARVSDLGYSSHLILPIDFLTMGGVENTGCN